LAAERRVRASHEPLYRKCRSWLRTEGALLASLVAFLDEHRYCGELDGGADDDRVWMTCTCGAVISQALGPVHR
jgi:hypothetical protein